MNLLGLPLSASAWLAPMTALAVVAGGAAVVLLRDHLRLERQLLALRDEVERLSTALQQATRAAARSGDEAEPPAALAPTRSPQTDRPNDRPRYSISTSWVPRKTTVATIVKASHPYAARVARTTAAVMAVSTGITSRASAR